MTSELVTANKLESTPSNVRYRTNKNSKRQSGLSGSADSRLASLFHVTSFPFDSFRRNKLPIRVRFDAQSTRMQKTTAPDRNATRRARNSGQLFFGQVSDFHPERMR